MMIRVAPHSPPATHPVQRRAPLARSENLLTRWPALALAMRRYEERIANEFVDAVQGEIVVGLIPGAARRRLAARAAADGISPFDAQLLIACTLREWLSGEPQRGSAKHLARRASPAALIPATRRPRWMKAFALITLAILLDIAVLTWWLH